MSMGPPAPPQWQVYGFPAVKTLVFSTRPVSDVRNYKPRDAEERRNNHKQLDLEAGKSDPVLWTDPMKMAYEQVGHRTALREFDLVPYPGDC